jgi:hypothetical protein
MTSADREIRLKALTRLAIATREKPEPQTYAVYLDDTKGFSTEAILRACRHLEHSLQWFPKVSELRQACDFQEQRLVEARAQRRPKLADGDVPVSPEKWSRFRQDVANLVNRREMK